MTDYNNWFYLCLALSGVMLIMLAMFFNYSIKLGQRTFILEKKNGHEQYQIDQLKQELNDLKKKLKKYEPD